MTHRCRVFIASVRRREEEGGREREGRRGGGEERGHCFFGGSLTTQTKSRRGRCQSDKSDSERKVFGGTKQVRSEGKKKQVV